MPIVEVPDPDPLVGLTGWLTPVRHALRLLAVVLGASALAVLISAGAWVSGQVLALGSPVTPGLEIPMGDDREMYLSALDWGPPTMLYGALVAAGTYLLTRLTVRLTAALVPDALGATRTAYRRRIADLGAPRGLRRRIRRWGTRRRVTPVLAAVLADLTYWALVALTLALGWLIGSSVASLSPVPQSWWGLVGRIGLGLCLLAAAAFARYACWLAGGYLLYGMLRPWGITRADLEAMVTEAHEGIEKDALDRWPRPDGPVVRLDAAVSVMADPPAPRRRRDRSLDVPWTGGTAGVDSLAATLLAVSVWECADRGLLSCTRVRGRPVVRAELPPGWRPEGLARIVLGHHRGGLDDGRRVDGPLRNVVAGWLPTGDEDPHWRVIETAFEDLRAAGLLSDDGMDHAALKRAAGAVPRQRRAGAASNAHPALFRSLLHAGDVGLRKSRIVDAEGSFLVQIILLTANQRRRRGHVLPPVAEAGGAPGGVTGHSDTMPAAERPETLLP